MTVLSQSPSAIAAVQPRTLAAPQPVRLPSPRWWIPVTLAVGSAGLLWLCFFPMNLGFLGWVALVPFLTLTVRPNPRWVYLAAFLGGLAFGLPAVQWLRLAAPQMYPLWILLAVFVAMHFLVFVVLTRWLVLSGRFPLILAAPAVWTVLEFGRAQLDIGFAWYLLGHTQHDYLAMIQAADVFGAYGLSFLLMMANVVIFQGLCWLLDRWRPGLISSWFQIPEPPTRGTYLMVSAGIVAVLVIATLIYGSWRLAQDDFAVGPKVALVQGSIPQEIRNDPKQAHEQDMHFDALGREAAKHGTDLIVFPETSFTFHWLYLPTEAIQKASALCPDHDFKDHLAFCRDFSELKPRDWRAPLLLGVNSLQWDEHQLKQYNSAILLNIDGTHLGRYDKCCRVPFGEYMPFRETLPFMMWFSPYDHEYGIAPGQELTLFELPGSHLYRFGVLICYEDSVPHLARRFMQIPAADGPPNFFLNISNDGWFRGSEEHEQHLVAARFRAVECRRSVARAVNMGISAVIDGNGRIVALPGPTWRTSKGVAGIVTANIPIDHRGSLYVFWGDVLPLACVLICLVGLVIAAVRWWRSPC
jgi:apolipoprotein N-acyltransferase